MKTLIIIIASISWLLTSDAWSQNAKTTGTLTFNITGFADNSGQVIVELYFKGDKVPTKPSKHIKGKIVNKSAVVLVENLGPIGGDDHPVTPRIHQQLATLSLFRHAFLRQTPVRIQPNQGQVQHCHESMI